MAAADKTDELACQFALLDHDKNGEVTAAELLHTVTELGLALTDEEVWQGARTFRVNHYIVQIDEIMSYADIDGDGKIEVRVFSFPASDQPTMAHAKVPHISCQIY